MPVTSSTRPPRSYAATCAGQSSSPNSARTDSRSVPITRVPGRSANWPSPALWSPWACVCATTSSYPSRGRPSSQPVTSASTASRTGQSAPSFTAPVSRSSARSPPSSRCRNGASNVRDLLCCSTNVSASRRRTWRAGSASAMPRRWPWIHGSSMLPSSRAKPPGRVLTAAPCQPAGCTSAEARHQGGATATRWATRTRGTTCAARRHYADGTLKSPEGGAMSNYGNPPQDPNAQPAQTGPYGQQPNPYGQQPAYGQPAYGQAPYGQPGYGAPAL